MGKYEDYLKRKEAAKSGNATAASTPNKTTQNTAQPTQQPTSKYDEYLARKQAVKEAGNNESFKLLGSTYIVDSLSGKAKKSNVGVKSQSVKDARLERETGHESFITDFTKSLSGGTDSWGASQLSTAATIPLAISAAAHKDNFYEPEKNSTLWKMLKASSANTNYASELMQDSKEGRGKVGQIVMDVGSQAVMNGIDAAIRSIPGIGQALGTASFMSRSFGGTAQQKRDEGKSVATQVLSGAVSAGIEQFTESMARISGVRSYTGADTGWLQGAYTNLEAGLAKKFGPVIAKLSTSMLSEGVEEIASDLLTPLITSALHGLTKDTKLLGDFEAEELQSIGDIAYDGLIGALSAIGGGVLESTQALDTYNKLGKDNALYAKAVRQEYENNKADARRGRSLQIGSLFDAVNTLFNKETGESLTERASKAAGTFVRNKDVASVLAQRDADYVRIVNEVADKFAEQSFANEAVDKDVLKKGIVNFFMNGDFSEDLNSIEGAKNQLKSLAREIIRAEAESRLEKARGSKNKAKEAYYTSLLSDLVNGRFTETATDTNIDDITEARTYGYSAEELAADQATREAERQRMESKGTYDNGEDVPFFTDDDAFTEEAPVQQPSVEAAPVETESETETPVSEVPVEQQVETTEEEEEAPKLTTPNRKKVEQLFNGTKKSLILASDANSQAVVDAIFAQAKSEGKEVVISERKDGKRRYTIRDSSPLFDQSETISQIYDKLGLERKEVDSSTKINRLASDSNSKKKQHLKATMYFSYGNQKRADITADTTFDAILNGERTATTREAKWKGHQQWKDTKVGDIIEFSENKDGSGRSVTVMVDGKYTVKARIDDDTIRIADDNGNTYKLRRSQWSKKEGWAENSKWFGEMSPGDIWITYKPLSEGDYHTNFNEIRERTISGELGALSDSDLQLAMNYYLKQAGISRRSKNILDDISDFILGNFEKDFVGNFGSSKRQGFSIVEADYSTGDSDSRAIYVDSPEGTRVLNYPDKQLYRDQVVAVDDDYSLSDEDWADKLADYNNVTLSDTAKALLNIIARLDQRRIDINHWIATSPSGTTNDNIIKSEAAEDKIRKINNLKAENNGSYASAFEDYYGGRDDLLKESFLNDYFDGVFDGTELSEDADKFFQSLFNNDKDTIEIVSALRGADQTVSSELKSALESGFGPSAIIDVKSMTVAERLRYLQAAYPDSDYHISPSDPNRIVNETSKEELHDDQEYQYEENRWNKRHLRNGVEADDNQTAFGYLPVDAERETQIGTNKKGNPIIAKAWADAGNISVEDKVSAQNALRTREEIDSNIKNLQKQIDSIDKSIGNIKIVLANTTDPALRSQLLSQINALAETGMKFRDMLTSSKDLYEQIDRQRNRAKSELSRNGKQGHWNSTIRQEKTDAIKNTWIDNLSDTELVRYYNQSKNWGNIFLSKEESGYLESEMERRGLTGNQFGAKQRNSMRNRISSKAGPDVGVATGYTTEIGENNEQELLNEQERQLGENNLKDTSNAGRFSAANRNALRDSEERPRVSGYSEARQFEAGFSTGEGRVTYKSSGSYLSTIDDSDTGNNKQVGRILTAEESTGEQYDTVRARFANSNTTVMFLDGQIFDSESGTLNDGCVITFSNGETVAIVQMNDESQTHEKTHLSINKQRAAGNRAFIVGYENAVDRLFAGEKSYTVSLIKYYVSKYGGYSGNDVLDEIIANINAGITRYGVDFSKYKPALEKSPLYKYLVEETDSVGESNVASINRLASDNDNIPSLNEFRAERGETSRQDQFGMEENEDNAAKGSQRIQMDDAEFNQLRQNDLNVTTLRDFERQQKEQPKAEKKMSPAEANEMAERSFGKKGRVRATRVVEKFPTNFKMAAKALTDAQADVLNNNLGKMRKALTDINDGYGTVKDAADIYKSWRDNKLLADYYDEDIAARFDKILGDAEAKGWTFEAQDQREFAQAYEEACNAMTARINNVNRDADRTSRLAAEAVANKLNINSDGLISKAIQRFIRMQITTDTAMKLFGGFKGSGEFYQLGKDIKDAVSKRMVKYVDAYSYFDAVKKMDGFKEFSQNTKRYRIDPGSQFLAERNPLKGHEFTIQQIVTMDRLFKTLNDTFKKSDVTASDRIKGFVIRDADGKSITINLTDGGLESSYEITAVENACMRFLSQEGAVFEAARAYSEACDKMFKMLGKDVSAVKKAITGNGLSLIGDNYTPVLWANEDGTPADFNFNDDDRIRPPAFLYKRTGKEGHLVISDISYIVDKYIEKAADYVGTAQIKDTLARLNNGTALANKGKGLNSALAENFGKDAGVWFDEYVKDLTEYGENDSIWAALRRNMQKGALIGSPSVMMKQTSSYWSAMGLLSPEALTMAYRWKVGVKAADNTEYNKLLKYRHISDNIDPTLTEIIKGTNKYGSVSNSRVFKLFTNGISEQDFKTVDNLYTATMIDTYLKNQNKSAEYFTSGEFQNDIDSKFTEVMLRSQPMFDTELRAEYARTDNELVKMTSMFRTQQTQNLNLIATAIGEYNAATGADKAEKGKVLRNTIAGQASAALSLSLLSAAADAMLHGLKKYRGDGDDDDEEAGDGKIELERILGRIGINTIETGAGTVWFGDSVAKWLIDRMSGGETSEFYGLNMGPITTFKNVLDNLEYVAKSPTPSNIKNVATNISQLMGIPLNNAYRYVNSVVMYTADITGNNEHKYDDMLKMWGNNAKVSEKNMSGRNRLVEAGMTKKEANALVKIIDEDGSGLSKDELQEYYIAHPEDADKVSILWNSMGWKTSFEKTKPNLDKKAVYRSNPLYALMDTDESESVSKSEFTDYALEHQDQMDELSAMYKEQGYKGSLRSAMRSAEQTQLKETAEDAFYENNYNVLFDTVSQMKNGKTWLNSLIRDEYDEYDGKSNPIIRYMIDAKRSAKEVDAAVEEYGATKFVSQYKALRASGLAPSVAITKLDNFDANANGSITQAELAEYYKANKDEEAMIAEFWKACGWSTTWSKYKKSKKIA